MPRISLSMMLERSRRFRTAALVLTTTLPLLGSHGFADEGLEDQLFGTPATEETQLPQSSLSLPAPQSLPGQGLLSTTTIGGRADLSSTLRLQSDEPPAEMAWGYQPTAYLYLDSRPRPDTRAFLRVSLTGDSGSTFTDGSSRPGTSASLDILELWAKWQPADSSIFWTIGRQPIRWGAGQIWQPTDFLSATFFDPLAQFDDRRGTDAARLTIPFEAQNASVIFVASRPSLGQSGSSDARLRDLQLSGRFEWSFGSTEIAASASMIEGGVAEGPKRFGLAVSSGVGAIDVVLEGACTKDAALGFFERDTESRVRPVERKQQCLPQGVAGLAWQQGYGDADSFTIGGEFFWNGLGHDSPQTELAGAALGGARPLYIGQQYAGGYVFLPAPRDWDDTTFQAQYIKNLTDFSELYRFSLVHEILESSRLILGTTLRKGTGEFHLTRSAVSSSLENTLPEESAAALGNAYARATPNLLLDATVSLEL